MSCNVMVVSYSTIHTLQLSVQDQAYVYEQLGPQDATSTASTVNAVEERRILTHGDLARSPWNPSLIRNKKYLQQHLDWRMTAVYIRLTDKSIVTAVESSSIIHGT